MAQSNYCGMCQALCDERHVRVECLRHEEQRVQHSWQTYITLSVFNDIEAHNFQDAAKMTMVIFLGRIIFKEPW